MTIMDTIQELRPDSDLEKLILRELHRHSERHTWLVKPDMFHPPISMRDIGRIARRLKDQDWLKTNPDQARDGWWLSMSTKGILHCEENL